MTSSQLLVKLHLDHSISLRQNFLIDLSLNLFLTRQLFFSTTSFQKLNLRFWYNIILVVWSPCIRLSWSYFPFDCSLIHQPFLSTASLRMTSSCHSLDSILAIWSSCIILSWLDFPSWPFSPATYSTVDLFAILLSPDFYAKSDFFQFTMIWGCHLTSMTTSFNNTNRFICTYPIISKCMF